MSEKHGKRNTPRFKFQVVIEILSGTKAIGQIARSYGVHPIMIKHLKIDCSSGSRRRLLRPWLVIRAGSPGSSARFLFGERRQRECPYGVV